MAGRPGAAPGKLSFGDSAARLVRDLSLEKLERPPGVAPGQSPWRGGILLLNHSRIVEVWSGECGVRNATDGFHTPHSELHTSQKLKGLGHFPPQAFVPLQQRTNTVTGRYCCGHRYFTVDLSVFGAHLPRSP